MFQKSIIAALLILSSVSTIAAPALPFIGTKQGKYPGNKTTWYIKVSISQNRNLIIKSCAKSGCEIAYSGTYKEIISPEQNLVKGEDADFGYVFNKDTTSNKWVISTFELDENASPQIQKDCGDTFSDNCSVTLK